MVPRTEPDQAFKHLDIWETFLIQATIVLFLGSEPHYVAQDGLKLVANPGDCSHMSHHRPFTYSSPESPANHHRSPIHFPKPNPAHATLRLSCLRCLPGLCPRLQRLGALQAGAKERGAQPVSVLESGSPSLSASFCYYSATDGLQSRSFRPSSLAIPSDTVLMTVEARVASGYGLHLTAWAGMVLRVLRCTGPPSTHHNALPYPKRLHRPMPLV